MVALLVRLHHGDTLLSRLSVCFIEITMFPVVREVSLLDASKPCGASYERVPSVSNIADLPRGENDAAALMIDQCQR